jgi:Zn-dependent M28 family amino/carboxypeptidase
VKLGFGILVFVTVGAGCQPFHAPTPLPPGLAADVAYLSSPALDGRATGTAGSDSAAVYIVRQYQRLGLSGAFQSACELAHECPTSYFQFFKVDGVVAQNIGVMIPGTDSSLHDQYIVAGAHYDHLGHSSFGSRDPEAGLAIRPGADDNASGSAALLELARRFAAHPPRRSVLLVHFDAEELGLVGSGVFVDHPPVPRQAIVLMVNFDMVGRMRARRLIVDVSPTNAGLRALVDSAAHAVRLRVLFSSITAGRTDNASFRLAGIQTVSLFTGFHYDYHRATDVAARVYVPGIELAIDVAEAVVRAAANKPVDSARR